MTSLGVTGELRESKIDIEWKIADVSSLSAAKGSYYTSSTFVFANTSLHLCIYPTGTTTAKSGFLSAFLVNESKAPIHVNMTLHIKKADGTMIAGGTSDINIETSWGYHSFYEKSSLEQNKSELLPSDILTIVCVLKLKQDEKQGTVKAETVENLQREQPRKMLDHKRITELDVLSENFKDLFTNKDSCDALLQVKDKEFKAHKLILMARSSVFAAMFQHDTLEKQTGIVKIPDCDPESFQEFLDYLYCGKLEDVSYHSAFQLYITSSKYDVQKLKEYCVEYLIESLAADNVCEIVKLADKYDEEKLLSKAQEFFNENWNQIFVTTEWGNLMKNDHHLAQKLLIEFSKTKE